MKIINCDVFQTEITQKGIIPVFCDIVPYSLEIKKKGFIIPLDLYNIYKL